MPGPFDYSIQRVDPLQRAFQGLQIGGAIKKPREAEETQQKAEALKKQYSFDVQEAFKDPTPQKMAMLIAKHPGQREAFKQGWDVLNEDQKKNELQTTGQVYSALLSNNTEVANNIINEQITARSNSGQDTSKLQSIKDYIERDPKGATGYAGLVLSSLMGEKEFAKTFKTLGEERRAEETAPQKRKKENAEIAKLAAETGLSKAKTNKVIIEGKNLGIEGKKALVELEYLKSTGGKDPEKTFNQEEKLRKEYSAKTKNFHESKVVLDKIRSSVADSSGAGDLALVFSFMKMLDPGSVVRESEFALASDTAGLFARLKNTAEKIQTGQFLTPSQRGDFGRLAEKYMKSSGQHEKRTRKSLEAVIKNYSLNPDNIFGVEEVAVVTDGDVVVEKSYLKYGKTK